MYCYCGSQYAWTLTDIYDVSVVHLCDWHFKYHTAGLELRDFKIENTYGVVPLNHQPDSHGALGVPQRGR